MATTNNNNNNEDSSNFSNITAVNTSSLGKIGFKFNKSVKPKSIIIQPVKLGYEPTNDTINNKIDFITSIDNKKIYGSNSESSSSSNTNELVIPLISVNKYKIKNKNVDNDSSSTNDKNNDDIIWQAKQELIKEANKTNNSDSMVIPAWKLMVINKVPDGYESDAKLDVSLRPNESTLDDYENVPVEGFGCALLRGMGWKSGQPIGGVNKAITPIIEPNSRPRGLGLGADISLQKQLENVNNSTNRKKNVNNDGKSPMETNIRKTYSKI